MQPSQALLRGCVRDCAGVESLLIKSHLTACVLCIWPHFPRDSPMCKVKRALALLLPAERIQAAQRRSMKHAWRAGRMACVTLS